MKLRITKFNWPIWLLVLGLPFFLIFMWTLDYTPGYLAWLLGLVLALAIGGPMLGSAVLLFRAFRFGTKWVASEVELRKKRAVGFTVGVIAASPFIYFWFMWLSLVYGFMSIAVGMRAQYH